MKPVYFKNNNKQLLVEAVAPTFQNEKPVQDEKFEDENYYLASSWTLMRRRFLKHRLALVGTILLSIIYLGAIFAGFLSVAGPFERHTKYELLSLIHI